MKNRRIRQLFLFILLSVTVFVYAAQEIKNKDKPLRGEWNFHLEKKLSIDRAGEELFANPRQVMAADDGTIYVYDNKNKRYYIFKANGDLIRAVGKQGEGPGEIKRIDGSDFFLVNDKMIIADIDRLHYFTRDGIYIQSKINNNLQRRPVCFLDEDRFISYPYALSLAEDANATIIVYNLKTSQEKIIGKFKVFAGGTDRRSSEQQPTVIVKGIAPMIILNRYDNRLYYGMNHTYLINITDLEGNKISAFSLERQKKDISDKALRNRFSTLPQKPPPDVIDAIVRTLPRQHTYFVRIEIHNGLLYIFEPDLENENHQSIDIFTLEGKYLYRSDIKAEKGLNMIRSPYNNLFIKKDYLYLALENEDGEITIVQYKISLPKL